MAKKKVVPVTEAVVAPPMKAIIYSDGGCRPSRGIGGWGIHGYTFTEDTPKQGSGCKNNVPTATGYVPKTDEDGKPLRGKEPVPVTVLEYLDGWGSIIPESTNNISELTGAIKALEWVLMQDLAEVVMRLDSEYVNKGIQEWHKKWEANGWLKSDGQPVPNAALWKRLIELREAVEARGCVVAWVWIKGHSGQLGNDTADKFATRGVVVGRKGLAMDSIKVTAAKGYWSAENDYSKFLTKPRWYFNTHVGGPAKSFDNRSVYYLGDHGKDDDLWGKQLSDASFSIVYLKDPDPVLDSIVGYQDLIDTSTNNNVVIGRLDNILSSVVYDDIKATADLFLEMPKAAGAVYTSEDVPITKELTPARLAHNAFEGLLMMERTLLNYIKEDELPDHERLTLTDLTSLLYDVDTGKSKTTFKLRSLITSNTRSLDVDASYDVLARKGKIKLPLTVGIDIASRNALAALAPLSPKVTLATWRESEYGFRYATIIEADGNIGIWAGIYSNIRILKP